MAREGLFITFEGIDGSGKSTQAHHLAGRLRGRGLEVIETREPGGAPGAEEIRRLLVEGEPGRWSAETEILLFTAARRDHVERVIGPALDRGAIVVCDRYVDSTRAYQTADNIARRKLVEELHRLMIDRDPDLTLIFDMEPEEAEARIRSRDPRRHARPTGSGHDREAGGIEDRFERRGLAFQQRLRAVYRRIAEEEPTRARRIEASGSPEEVAARVWAAVGPVLETL